MIDDVDTPTGRRAGALSWAGAANLFVWMDRRRGRRGIWAAQQLPFFDPVAIAAFWDFETAVYSRSLR